jgi:hypothetical protein
LSCLALEDGRITSDSVACVAIHGAMAAPAIRRCTVHDGGLRVGASRRQSFESSLRHR